MIQLGSLRLAVACLGSGPCHAWWRCDFLSETGLAVAAYNFPRNPLLASFQATSLAAKHYHDESIGRRGSRHLFRLPTQIEVGLHQHISQRPEALDRSLLTKGGAMSFLALLAECEIDPPEGPVQVGGLDDCASKEGLSEMAKHYHAAFRAGRMVLPYFAAAK